MSVLAAADHGGYKRWAVAAALAFALHAVAITPIAVHSNNAEGDDGNAAIEVEIGPFVTTPSETKDDLPPGTRQELQEETAQPLARSDAEKEEQIKADSDPNGEIAMPQPRQQESPAPPVAPPSPVTAPPKQRAAAAQMASWKRRIAQAIAGHQGYPASALARRETGEVEVAFALDRKGAVVSSRITRSSSHAALDQEALDTVARAAPYPPPPPSVADNQLEFKLPIGFTDPQQRKR